MIRTHIVRALIFSWSALFGAASALGQNPAAVQPAQLSAFAGLSPSYTGLDGGRNLGITAGLDLKLPPVSRHFRPGVEVRGTYPVDGGSVDSQRDILGGLRADFWLGHRLHPYADILFGRGEMKYGKGYFFQNQDYLLTTTWVESYGAGIDYDLTPHFALKLDGQFQHWGSAPLPGGSIYAKAGTLGVVYIFNFNRHGIH